MGVHASAGGANNTMRNNKVNFNKITRSNTELFDCGETTRDSL